MSQEDRKLIQLFFRGGLQLNILTRMPFSEIEKELHQSDFKALIELEGLNHVEDRVRVTAVRTDFVAACVEKFTPPPTPAQRIAIPRA